MIIGIDPGVNTGIAVVENGELTDMDTVQIHEAMLIVREFSTKPGLKVYVEDARLRRWFGGADARQATYGAGIREGVGSVKRDCQIWEGFLHGYGIKYEMVKPMANRTKLSSAQFKKLTGFCGRTSQHARDAAMLIWGK